jgi:hypothetical protein
MQFSARRVQRAMAKSFDKARAATVEARECKAAGYTIGYRAALEVVAECRKLNSQRRRALVAGHAVAA